MKLWHAAIPVCVLLLYMTFGVRRISKSEFPTETAAIQALKTIHIAQVQYSSHFDRYARSLAELAGFIRPGLASGEERGYKFTLRSDGSGYQVIASPDAYGVTGTRSFYSDQTMIIRESEGPEPANANSKELGAVRKRR